MTERSQYPAKSQTAEVRNIVGIIRQAEREATSLKDFPNELYLPVIAAIRTNSVLHHHKVTSMKEAFRGIQDPDAFDLVVKREGLKREWTVPVVHIPGYEEDDYKHSLSERPEVAVLLIAMLKAMIEIPNQDNEPRSIAAARYLLPYINEAKRPSLDGKDTWLSSRVISVANDIVQCLDPGLEGAEAHIQHKPELDTKNFSMLSPEEREYQTRVQVYELLQKTVGTSSPHIDSNGLITLRLQSATALHEAISNVGVVKKDETIFECDPATDEQLHAIVFGLYDAEHPVGKNLKYWLELDYQENAAKHMPRWSPEKGLDIVLLTKVNGGWKVDHPLITKLCVQRINGIPWWQSSEIASETDRTEADQVTPLDPESEYHQNWEEAQKLAAGYPKDLALLLNGLMHSILSKYGLEQSSQVGRAVAFQASQPTHNLYELRQVPDLTAELDRVGVLAEGSHWQQLVITPDSDTRPTGKEAAQRLVADIDKLFRLSLQLPKPQVV